MRRRDERESARKRESDGTKCEIENWKKGQRGLSEKNEKSGIREMEWKLVAFKMTKV